ncbi:MAG: hypothetical protein CVU08_06195 [Bacteroidetes bacterium HGW-Bacteroidetes-3]|nr:MAG: hypothetical protein CVU08_06195 [Bacteroidetes bacterium HGW-Bacteroidetes-3]
MGSFRFHSILINALLLIKNNYVQKHNHYSTARGWVRIKKILVIKKFIKSIFKNFDFNVGLLWGNTFQKLALPNK